MISSLNVDLIVCVMPSRVSLFLQLEAGSRSRSNRFLSVELDSELWLCQTTMVLDTSLPHQGEKASSMYSTLNITMESPAMVPNNTETPGGLPLEDSLTRRPNVNAIGVKNF